MIDKKVALITGAGRGIGRGIAVQLAQAGWAVVINDIGNPEPPAETLAQVEGAGSQGLVVLADITRFEDREHLLVRTLEAFGRIDLLVNNAGIGPRVRKDILEVGEESLREVLEVNLIAPFFLTQKVVLAMLDLIAQGAHCQSQNHQYWLDQRFHQQPEPPGILPFQGRRRYVHPAVRRPAGRRRVSTCTRSGRASSARR